MDTAFAADDFIILTDNIVPVVAVPSAAWSTS